MSFGIDSSYSSRLIITNKHTLWHRYEMTLLHGIIKNDLFSECKLV